MTALNQNTGATVQARILEQKIGLLTFHNPKQRNALSVDLLQAMDDQLARFEAQRVPVVIVGAEIGQAVWSAGHDLGELHLDHDPVAYGRPLEKTLRRVRSYPGAVIAMVSGTVWGGAVDLVMSCDLAIADHSAAFTMTPAKIGLPYTTGGLLRFFNNLPIHILKEMFFCARTLDAQSAWRFGVINELTAQDQLLAAAQGLARGIAANAPLAIQAMKEQLRVLEELQPMPVQAMEKIAEMRRRACESDDFTEGLAALSQRRKPVFGGT